MNDFWSRRFCPFLTIMNLLFDPPPPSRCLPCPVRLFLIYICMNAEGESPKLNLKAKATIWLVSHHLRSLSTVKERFLYEKHAYTVERVIFGCFEFTLLGTPEVQRPAAEADFCPFWQKAAKSRIYYIL